ncbi:sulfite exporter TauE/SafE family protein [Cytobacillus sp. Hm23]
MMIILILIGFCASFIGTLAGSGGLISMPALLLLGVPIHSAIAAAKFSNIFSSFSSFYTLFRKKEVTLSSVVVIVPLALLGGITGALCASVLSEQQMTMIAIVLLSFALVVNILKKLPKEEVVNNIIPKSTRPLLFFNGVYDGLFGPGQATLLMYTHLYNGLSYIKAMAFTRFQTFMSCIGAFFTYFFAGYFDWQISILLATGSLIGGLIAVKVATKLSTNHLKNLLRIVTSILIIQLIIGI